MKVGIIRCQQTEDMCAGTTCLKVVKEGTGTFQNIENPEIIGFISCGGCPGKKAIPRAKRIVDNGAQAIALASCITKGTPIGFPCPHAEMIKTAIRKKVGAEVLILDYSH